MNYFKLNSCLTGCSIVLLCHYYQPHVIQSIPKQNIGNWVPTPLFGSIYQSEWTNQRPSPGQLANQKTLHYSPQQWLLLLPCIIHIVTKPFFSLQESRRSRYSAPLCPSWKPGGCQGWGPERSSWEQFEIREQREGAGRGTGLQIPAIFRPTGGKPGRGKLRRRKKNYCPFPSFLLPTWHSWMLSNSVNAKRICMFVFSFQTSFS